MIETAIGGLIFATIVASIFVMVTLLLIRVRYNEDVITAGEYQRAVIRSVKQLGLAVTVFLMCCTYIAFE